VAFDLFLVLKAHIYLTDDYLTMRAPKQVHGVGMEYSVHKNFAHLLQTNTAMQKFRDLHLRSTVLLFEPYEWQSGHE